MACVVKFDFLTAMNITAALLWNVTSYSVIDGYQHFEGILRAEMEVLAYVF
jgi:hypothetical protein